MRNILLISSFALLISCDQTSMNKLEYPESRKENQVDDYWGTKVSDPYIGQKRLNSGLKTKTL